MKKRLSLVIFFALGALAAGAFAAPAQVVDAAVLLSANVEWSVVKAANPGRTIEQSPFGEYFLAPLEIPGGTTRNVLFFQGGWGKVAAAASTQYVIDRFRPSLLLNLGTCGGFEGAVERGTIVLADRTIIYDIIERMGNPEDTIRERTTEIDLFWLRGPLPSKVLRTTLVSGDQDLDPQMIPVLREKYKAVAGDWESGAIAYIASRNRVRLLILRGVSDLVSPGGGEAYGNVEVFEKNTETIMKKLLADLPAWLAAAL
jgi:adenosylhomocysteine nucleosidase